MGDLPYSFIHHLREALLELKPPAGTIPSTKETKNGAPRAFARIPVSGQDGFYVGNGNDLRLSGSRIANCVTITTSGGTPPTSDPENAAPRISSAAFVRRWSFGHTASG